MTIEEEAATIAVRWDLNFQFKLGQTAGRFMAGLRDQQIRGTRCTNCQWTFVPPQAYCERCMHPVDEWVDIAQTGVIDAFTVVHIAPGGPPPPFVLATIRLDGADGLLHHHIGNVEFDSAGTVRDLRPGDRVEAVWSEQRTGQILDIAYFAPIDEQR
ncbi:Zn-ribbon domain-containing OB-fold protein [Rhodococcus sp. NPDC057014]|uniref:Zn-ribbon domain-containing OB-fold protein n=1 Tax=Rhodococcus sp. NPDC057014 TaxID=3346000 RepID=UPI003644DB07